MNQVRRDRLRDAAVEVLSEEGGRGLTHRAVDAAAQVPLGTTKNYYPTRDALLGAVAARCAEQYRAVAAQLVAVGAASGGRDGLVRMLRGLLANVAGPGRSRMLAYRELQADAARRPWLAGLLDPISAADFTGFEQAQRAAGLPVTRQRAATVTLALHAAVPHLLDAGPATLAAAGLDDLDRFVRDLLDTVYPDGPDGGS
ncbi:TetR/AcrR family transcriptional regulator [Kitasatospora sp. NPDC094015]|uniref:TetR/AcrR family transcriptional regulator n=1 Tax=Kitasatospora sp. NPDC094015 TaxID=3155205 RepID=UPI003333AD7B